MGREDKTVALLGEVEERAIIIWEAEKGVSDQLVKEGVEFGSILVFGRYSISLGSCTKVAHFT